MKVDRFDETGQLRLLSYLAAVYPNRMGEDKAQGYFSEADALFNYGYLIESGHIRALDIDGEGPTVRISHLGIDRLRQSSD